MSKVGKACLLISGLFILASGVTRLVLNMWHDSLYVSLGLALVFFVVALIKDHKTYLEFFTMRTTKHGMNMGALILLAIVFLIAVNFIAVRNDKKIDFTAEGLNSLSEQSVKAAQAVKDDLKVVFIESGEKDSQQIDATRSQLQLLVSMYRNYNTKIDFLPINGRKRPDVKEKYGFVGGDYGIYVEYKGKNLKLEQPTEEQLTQTLLRATRDKKKTIYFTFGHGEAGINDNGPGGLLFLKQDLEASYDVKELKLLDTPKIPDDAAAVAVFGPTQQLVEPELKTLRDYVRAGGRLLIAADPGKSHNLAQLTKTVGIEFKNNFVLDPRMSIPNMGNVAALGVTFSQASEVTKGFPSGSFTIFELPSAISKAPDADSGLKLDDVVRTDAGAVSTDELSERPTTHRDGPYTIAMTSEGKLPDGTAEFAAFVVGDADFAQNKMYRANQNRDLITNAVSYLAKDTDLISIKPKAPKGTVLQLTRESGMLFVFGFLLPLPILMFGTGGYIWWRRRTA